MSAPLTEPWQEGAVVVTGGTGHVGLAIAKAFCEVGATTVAVGSSEERTRLAGEALEGFEGRGHAMRADTSLPDEVNRLFDEVEDRRSEEHTSELQSQ